MIDLKNSPHRRQNLLTGEWVLVSPHRAKRPWQGHQEMPSKPTPVSYDPTCYLCPGNKRVSGAHNPVYKGTYVFDNDHPALLTDTPSGPADTSSDLLVAQGAKGTARVICFSADHSLTLANMPHDQMVQVIDTWAEQLVDLGKTYAWVQIFENKGEIMGCSNPHPHGQIWASDQLPNEIVKADRQQHAYFKHHGRRLLLDYAELEIERQERVVASNDDWIVVVPFWALWPYETLLLPRFEVSHLDQLSAAQRDSLAHIMKTLLVKYDNLFNVSFPYSMGWHGMPQDRDQDDAWQLHAHYYPPLLRSATVKKFMVGYEMMAEAQRDITAEQAAATLAALSGE